MQGRRELGTRFLTYDTVFDDEYGFYDFTDENPQAAMHAMTISRTAYAALGMADMAHIDFRVGKSGQPLIMEVNSKPHITRHSGFMQTESIRMENGKSKLVVQALQSKRTGSSSSIVEMS